MFIYNKIINVIKKTIFGSIDKIYFENLRMNDYSNHSDLIEN